MKLPNRNQVLIAIGLLAAEGPDVASVAAWLTSLGIPRLIGVIHFLGFVSAALGGLALAWPSIRTKLALLGLATPPGAVAPWTPGRDAGPPAAVPCSLVGLPTPSAGSPGPSSAGPVVRKGTGYGYKGSATIVQFLVLAAIAAAMVLLFAIPAHAQTPSPQFGGCFAQGQVCLGPSASITLGELNLATSKFSGGIIPGVGYGVTYAQNQWYATGAALYFSFKAGQDGPNQAIPSLVLSFANYVRVGTGVAITETSGPVQTQWLLLFGLGSDFGGSPKYVQAQQRNARLAGEADGMLRARSEGAGK
ncbi:MAG: hypothetical protein ACLP66_10075 [Polyangia bacterium]